MKEYMLNLYDSESYVAVGLELSEISFDFPFV